MTLLIDTNIIIRYLAGDHAAFLAKSTELFEQVERGEQDIIRTYALTNGVKLWQAS
jgi:predicted nucleic acid-binding protein